MADQSIKRFARHGEKRSYRSRNNKFGIRPPFARFVMRNKRGGRQGKAVYGKERERNDGCKMIDRNGFYKCPLNYWGEHGQQALTLATQQQQQQAGGYHGEKSEKPVRDTKRAGTERDWLCVGLIRSHADIEHFLCLHAIEIQKTAK